MSDQSHIQWTDATWNPVVGCSRVNRDCDHCYAVNQSYRNERMGSKKYAGLTVLNPRGERHFNGVVRCNAKALRIPLRWREARMVFVNSMSDLFHPGIYNEFIAKVFAVMALCPQHTFQILTKRPRRMAYFLVDDDEEFSPGVGVREAVYQEMLKLSLPTKPAYPKWPLPNVWLGVSFGHQKAADEMIPPLQRCPAAVRFISYEPALEQVDFMGIKGIDWLICGGESGPDARPFDLAWARSARDQCRAAGTAFYLKQVGAKPLEDGHTIKLCCVKGGCIAEIPEDLRIREFPAARKAEP